ncbi:MAG TPA: outer membrane beta-barrel protein, partial [Nitrospira sp.]|nr:outer membrane beta-barrel protein [Nitrospira sp.]
AFSDSILEWKPNAHVTVAAEYQVGTQDMAAAGAPRVFYMGTAWPMRWHIAGPWSAALRPEFFWDRNGLLSGHEQFIKAVTTTAEYRVPYRVINMIARLEYRYDESRGPQGGFFKGNEIAPGVIGLTPAQHMLIFGLIWTLDSP